MYILGKLVLSLYETATGYDVITGVKVTSKCRGHKRLCVALVCFFCVKTVTLHIGKCCAYLFMQYFN